MVHHERMPRSYGLWEPTPSVFCQLGGGGSAVTRDPRVRGLKAAGVGAVKAALGGHHYQTLGGGAMSITKANSSS